MNHGELQRKRLRNDAVPHVWPEYPAYLTKISPKRRSGCATAENRHEKENDAIRKKLADAREFDKIVCVADIHEKLDRKVLPASIKETSDSEGNLVFYELEYQPIPKVKFSLVVHDDLSYQIVCAGAVIPLREVSSIVGMKIKFASDILKLITFLQARCQKVTLQDCVSSACISIKYFLSSKNVEDDKENKIQFLLEQLQLVYISPTGRRCSKVTIATCMIWYKTSPALYRLIISDGVLTIPSISYLRRLAGALTIDMEFSESTIAYLTARFARLNEREKNIAIVMDEVKTDQHVEYVGGNFPGSCDDGITKGLFSVMINSLGGKYCDMVAMIPVVTLDSVKMKEVYTKVLKGVTNIGFSTCALLVDGHRTNKKF